MTDICGELLAVGALGALTAGAVAAWAAGAAGQPGAPGANNPTDAGELIRNGEFAAEGDGGLPAHWSAWTPVWPKAACQVRKTADGLLVEAPNVPYAVGGARQQVTDIRSGQAYAVEAACTLRGIVWPFRSVLVRLTWMRKGKPMTPAGLLIPACPPRLTASGTKPVSGGRGPTAPGGSPASFRDVLVAPEGADGAEISLEVKWPQGGSVLWRRVSMTPTVPRPPRKVRIGTVYLRPKDSTPQRNLELFCQQIDAAGKLGLDIVCLPEAIGVVGTPRTYPDVAEPIPGPASKTLGQAASRNRIWVVAGLVERQGDAIYNTAVLIDRRGRLAGKYRKVHLPREEWQKGVTPGSEYPVFTTDFGTVAIQVCYDYFFPEAAEAFALQGAEILFAPTWGTTFADQDGRAEGETVFRVRARDNGLYLVPSVYDGSSMVIDPLGRILASNKGREGVFWAEADLNQRHELFWVGHWRSVGPRDRMPETYAPLAKARD